MHRRFLNLVLHHNNHSICSLHRVDLRRLFYETAEIAEQAAAANAKKKKKPLRALPMMNCKPFFKFKPSNFFTLLRESSIMMIDSSGRTTILDVDFNRVVTGDSMRHGKGPNRVCISTPHPNHLNSFDSTCLFILDLVPGSSAKSTFDVLRYIGSDDSSKPLMSSHLDMDCFWSSRPVPPFVDDPAYRRSTKMCSFMVLGRSTICVSSMEEGVGTYTFDMVSQEWSPAGRWVLPFCGNAEYVPELKLWFALSASSPHGLCALDLPAIVGSELPPELQCTWDYFDLPEQSTPYKRQLLNMGSGRFCIVSFFKTLISTGGAEYIIKDESAVFTAVEVRRCNGDEGPVRMINHMSKRYRFGNNRIHCVL